MILLKHFDAAAAADDDDDDALNPGSVLYCSWCQTYVKNCVVIKLTILHKEYQEYIKQWTQLNTYEDIKRLA